MTKTTTGTAPERLSLARRKCPTGNGSAARLAHVMALRRPLEGVMRRLFLKHGVPVEALPEVLEAVRKVARDTLNHPNPRARLVDRRERLCDAMEKAIGRAVLSGVTLRRELESRP
jgi:hypothetical protein